jgi:hypothetical protein
MSLPKVIHKFPLEFQGQQTVTMPRCSEILCAQMQNGVPTLWAIVPVFKNNSEEHHTRSIEIHGTGQEFDPPGPGLHRHYIGTIQNAKFVWHVFQVLPYES